MFSFTFRLLLTRLLFAAIPCNGQEKLTNIDYLGLGYDVFLGNPHSDLNDPGFRESIFRLDYNDRALSSDGKWLIPDNVQALQTFGCGYETETLMIHGSTSYKNSLSFDVNVYGHFWFFSFSASTGYKEVHQGTNKYQRSYVSSEARCMLYQASIERLSNSRLTDDFHDAVVNGLPNKQDDEKYLQFISIYGTHYTSELGMGSKAIVRSQFEATTWTKLDQSDFNFKFGAHASFLGFAGGLKFSTEKTREMAASFDSNRTSMVAMYMGCRPSSDGKWETWMDSTEKSPYPITYELRPITELFSQQYFPNISADVLAAKRSILNATFYTYCRQTIGCDIPGPDRIPIKMDRPDTKMIGVQRASCRSGMSLLSCGLGNLPFTTSPDSKRCAIPVDNRTCECYAPNGATCMPWCTNAVHGNEVKFSAFIKGSSQANCPAGKKVTGCTIDPRAGRSDEWFRSHYPISDGSGCMCYSVNGAHCYAMCASNVVNYEVVSQYGMNDVTARCSPTNYVLGCGVQLQHLKLKQHETQRTFTTSSTDSCTCFDRYGVTCFAICGRLI